MKNWKIAGLVGAILLLSMQSGANAASMNSGDWYHKGFTQWHPQARSSGLGSAGTQCYFCKPDPDGDDDGDGVANSKDKCPTTPPKVAVNISGCALDSDQDGVPDYLDKCPSTPARATVNARGCPIDSDGDGVPDYLDKCPGTPANTDVDSKGCNLDTDGDGVFNSVDKCPNTPSGAHVTSQGCWVIKDLTFKFDKAVIDTSASSTLDSVLSILQRNTGIRVEIQGHTDSVGSSQYNLKLSQERAKAAMEYLVDQGIARSRLSSKGFGESKPIATNKTEAGRTENRRAELRIK